MNLFVIHIAGKVHRIRSVTMEQAWKKIYPTMVGHKFSMVDKFGKRFIVYRNDEEIAKITKIPRRQL